MQQPQTPAKLPFQPLLLIAPFFFWGTAMVAMKGLLPHTTPFFMAGVRLVPAGVLVILAGILSGRPQPKGWQAWLWISIFGLVDATLFQGFLAQGLVRTGAGLGSVMIDSQPLAVAILSLWLFQETIGFWGWLGLTIGIIGISFIGLPDDWILGLFNSELLINSIDISQLFNSGQLLMLFAALSMAIGTVLVRWVCRYADPVVGTGWHMIIGGLPLFGLSAISETQQWQNIDLSGLVAMGYSTLFGSAISYGLFFYFASSGSLTSLSSLTFLTPVFALLFGNLFLQEVLSPLQSLGVCLTLVSIYLVNQRETLAEKFKIKAFHNFTPSQTKANLLQPAEANSLEIPVEIHEVETSPNPSLHPKL
ncbi:MAG: EamA family transporter [Oscillatoriales cyanobacterium CG2_30_40_61]|nr:MAG: EamA family transporter [Oscillatoriales cyanobacterium CG2_30_40_61]